MKRMEITWVGCAATALLYAALLLPACSHDEDSLLTGPTSASAVSSGSELGPATHSLAQEDSDSGDSESADDDSADDDSADDDSVDDESADDDSVDDESVDDDSVDDDSVDDESVDDDSVDDDSVDDESVDDDSVDDDSVDDESADDDSADDVGNGGPVPAGAEGSSVRGLLSLIEGCPSTLTIGGTPVVTNEGTRFDCEPGCGGLEEGLDATTFCTFLAPGLPIKASGSDNGGVIDASRVRIDDEIKATGTISADSSVLVAGASFTLTVDGLSLQFVVGAGASIDAFAAGSVVRVEGLVPPLNLGVPPVFIATEIEN